MTQLTNGQCLMIKTKDRRKFFTHEKNFSPLLEFSRIFRAEISVVEVKDGEVLDLEQLAPALCDASFQPAPPVELRILEVKTGRTPRSRHNILRTARQVRAFIERQFGTGKVVSLADLSRRYKDLTKACLCNHLTAVRQNLEASGQPVRKVGGGKYQLVA